MKLQSNCPQCDKRMELVSQFPLSQDAKQAYKLYKCGHAFIQESESIDDIKIESDSFDGSMTARDYQIDGVKFALESGFNCLNADQMGLGKTIQALLTLRSKYEELTPCLILVKSATVWQWIKEYKLWADPLPLGIFLVQGTQSYILPGFKTYICSMDTFSKDPDRFFELGIKFLIIDEMHSFKNPESKRAQSLMKFIQKLSIRDVQKTIKLNCPYCTHTWDETITIQLNMRQSQTRTAMSRHYTKCPECKTNIGHSTERTELANPKDRIGIMMLTGTPILNRAEEYFIPLNILAPDEFPSLHSFRSQYLMMDEKKRWSRVSPYMIDRFKEAIKPYVIRRERSEVLKDLPMFRREFLPIKLENTAMRDAYNRELDKLAAVDARKANVSFMDIQENLMEMRRILGLAKCQWAAEYVEEFLNDVESEKIAIGVHHHAVRDLLLLNLKHHAPLKLDGQDSAERKNDILREFKQEYKRVAVLGILAAGEGLNIQFCNNTLVLERQWNSAKEEQFEDRFNRMGQTRPFTATYPIVMGTIDEFFHSLVSERRKIFGETIGNNWNFESDSDSVQQMVDWAVVNRL